MPFAEGDIMFAYKKDGIDFAHKYDEHPAPAPDYEKHYHDFFEILYFVQGDADFTVEDSVYKLHSGDIVFIQPGEHHHVVLNRKVSYERYVLKFSESLIPKYMFGRIRSRASFYNASKGMSALFGGLDDIYEKYSGDDLETLFTCRMLELMIMLCLEPEANKTAVHDNTITQIINYISENIREQITLPAICEHFHFSQSYISNKFSRHMKVSVISYVRTKKIMAAHREIMQGEKATDAAEHYGFTDYSTFYRAYVKVMGFPPSTRSAEK